MPDRTRLRVLEEQLDDEFRQPAIAVTGARIMEAIPERSGDAISRYEYALTLSLLTLRAKRDGHPPAGDGGIRLALKRMRRVLASELDPVGIAAGGLYSCIGCHFAHSALGNLVAFEPEAA